MYSRVARLASVIPAKKIAFTTAAVSAVYAYAQQCKNDLVEQRAYEEAEIPNDIREILKESPLHQLKENRKRYKKHDDI
ncbi:hypothetical protein G6F70_004446 [Rhizopus microsporus]|uniref:Uncharacterized protein n=2 Tax=Rhizopus TaxID=4842 RepID=A0A367JTZ4_RHIAZ|nr:hypothetical protein G6F71_008393 [Rhizopus microsporus]RCH93161.1 hypothetical protein CU097_008985 [Rhizopus azygosporus]KAG1199989.1 hypothetical protein G6F70_004446 [Rhizopus microsporus]KAG1207038.1 hypothetical protein G6F69_008365 [Rhizopus microsporus]KAG1227646.1 hypothetical protein G6F67_008321 [Rhizopus microsporus]